MSSGEPQKIDERTRTWGIVLMALLSAVLSFVLIKTRSPEPPRPSGPSIPSSLQAPAPEEAQPSAGDYYRAWPLFEGWPLPQTPAKPEPDAKGSGLPSE